MERLVLVASLRSGVRAQLAELLERQRSWDVVAERQGVFASDEEVVFFFEGDGAEAAVRDILDDPVRSTAVSPWLSLFDGPLHRCSEVAFIERGTRPEADESR
jgi:hypothetical protein